MRRKTSLLGVGGRPSDLPRAGPHRLRVSGDDLCECKEDVHLSVGSTRMLVVGASDRGLPLAAGDACSSRPPGPGPDQGLSGPAATQAKQRPSSNRPVTDAGHNPRPPVIFRLAQAARAGFGWLSGRSSLQCVQDETRTTRHLRSSERGGSG